MKVYAVHTIGGVINIFSQKENADACYKKECIEQGNVSRVVLEEVEICDYTENSQEWP